MSDHQANTPPDHIGWTLWQAAQVWRVEFTAAMVAAGHGWFGQARGNLMVHIGPSGLRQGDLVARARLTKQAVQQFVDELVADGILMRVPDEQDARARRLMLTEAGLAAMRDADRIKAEIEARWRDRLGSADFDRLDALLRQAVAKARPRS
ncbi:MAG: MarR family winged helix-turn-helix transcriptional regulator [Tabrizicola sp.]|jgi:DNA-binding MarR family transcriptional regulator|nr:MarR family winged helix-turn-helix transcriptional regulator [Tabrizicola sp.]